MYEIVARILTINVLDQKNSQVVLQKQVNGTKVAIAINLFGFWKDKFDALKLMKNEKIVGKLFLKSNLYKGKWYTDVYFKEVKRWEPKPKYDPETYQPKKAEHELFFEKNDTPIEYDPDSFFYDKETGEIR